jgi:WD40 repeat protein/serine/threonine protein kinase
MLASGEQIFTEMHPPEIQNVMASTDRNLDSLLRAALAIESPEQRAAYIRQQCGNDQRQCRLLENLLIPGTHPTKFLDTLGASLDTPVDGDPPHRVRSGADVKKSLLVTMGHTIDVPRVTLRQPDKNKEGPMERGNSAEASSSKVEGRYRIDGEIARGGMGAILKGRDNDLGRDLAFKVLLDEHRDRPEVIARFIEEAQIGGQLQHPGIAPVYELGQFTDQRPYFSMKLVKGQTLSQLLAERDSVDKDRSRFIGIFEQICQTVSYAHARGVIHRDLKPSNIMIGSFGEVQVMDWGLAKVLPVGEVAGEPRARSRDQQASVIETRRSGGSDVPSPNGSGSSETKLGSVLGTPAYMPPEQALGEVDQLDQRADVFGLGAILCEILTGYPPYVAEQPIDVFRMATRGKVDAAHARLDACGADNELIALAKHCMEPDCPSRPRDASIVAQRVTEFLESVESKLRQAERERAAEAARVIEHRKRVRAILVSTLALVLVLVAGIAGTGWGLFQANRASASKDAALRAETTARNNAQTAQRNEARQRAIAERRLRENQAISANLAYDRARIASENGRPDLGLNWFVRALELAPPDDLAFRDLIRTNLAEWETGVFELEEYYFLSRGGFPAGACMTADANRLYLCNKDIGVVEWTTTNGNSRIFQFPGSNATLDSDSKGGLSDPCPVALSDDELICSAGVGNTLYFWSVEDASQLIAPVELDTSIVSIDFHPAGNMIAMGCSNGKCYLYDLDQRQLAENPLPHGAHVSAIEFHPDGDTLMSAGYDSVVRLWQVSTGEQIQPEFAHVRAGITTATWSPDGDRIVSGDRGGIHVWDIPSGESVFELRTSGGVSAATFSPDGAMIAAGIEDGTVRMWDSVDFQPRHHAVMHDYPVHFMGFDDSMKQLLTLGSLPHLRIWTLPVEKLSRTEIPGGDANRMAINKDGSLLAFGGMTGNLHLCETKGATIAHIDYGEPIAAVTFNQQGNLLMVNGFKGSTKIFSTPDLQQVGKTITVAGMAMGGDFVDDHRVAIANMQENQIKIYDIASGDTIGDEFPHDLAVHVDIQGNRMITGSLGYGGVKSWDLLPSAELKNSFEDFSEVLSLSLSPDGEFFAVGTLARTAEIWRFDGSEPEFTFPHESPVKDVSLSDDMRFVATTGVDDMLRLWHVETERLVGPTMAIQDMTHARLASDGRVLILRQTSGTASEIVSWIRAPSINYPVDLLSDWVAAKTGIALTDDGTPHVVSNDQWYASVDAIADPAK